MTSKIKRLALFAHWDPDNIIDETVTSYLGQLAEVADIVFFSDCNLSPGEIKKVVPYTILRGAENHGEYDFGSYKRAFRLGEITLANYDEIILANDSCYFVGEDFNSIFSIMQRTPCDYWGLFEYKTSPESHWHLQSFFLVLKGNVFHHSAFKQFISGISKLRSKKDIIEKYEIGLSTLLAKNGFRRGSLIQKTTQNHAYNSNAFEVLRSHGVPIIKRDLLANNPLLIPDIQKHFINAKITPKNKILILEHLNRFTKGSFYYYWNLRCVASHFIHRKFIRWKPEVSTDYLLIKIKILGLSLLRIKQKHRHVTKYQDLVDKIHNASWHHK